MYCIVAICQVCSCQSVFRYMLELFGNNGMFFIVFLSVCVCVCLCLRFTWFCSHVQEHRATTSTSNSPKAGMTNCIFLCVCVVHENPNHVISLWNNKTKKKGAVVRATKREEGGKVKEQGVKGTPVALMETGNPASPFTQSLTWPGHFSSPLCTPSAPWSLQTARFGLCWRPCNLARHPWRLCHYTRKENDRNVAPLMLMYYLYSDTVHTFTSAYEKKAFYSSHLLLLFLSLGSLSLSLSLFHFPGLSTIAITDWLPMIAELLDHCIVPPHRYCQPTQNFRLDLSGLRHMPVVLPIS